MCHFRKRLDISNLGFQESSQNNKLVFSLIFISKSGELATTHTFTKTLNSSFLFFSLSNNLIDKQKKYIKNKLEVVKFHYHLKKCVSEKFFANTCKSSVQSTVQLDKHRQQLKKLIYFAWKQLLYNYFFTQWKI